MVTSRSGRKSLRLRFRIGHWVLQNQYTVISKEEKKEKKKKKKKKNEEEEEEEEDEKEEKDNKARCLYVIWHCHCLHLPQLPTLSLLENS